MYSFGKISKKRLSTCHPDIQKVVNSAMDEQLMDFSVLSGRRGEAEQNDLVAKGRSQLSYPKSNHNSKPSNAIDVAPYPVDWEDLASFKKLNFLIMKHAQRLNIRINCGAYWKNFKDYPHYELSKKVLEGLQ